MKKSTDLVRIKNLINCDRFRSSDAFIQLITKDLKKLLSDYFDFTSDVKLVITKEKNGFFVDINLIVDRIKSIGTLPN